MEREEGEARRGGEKKGRRREGEEEEERRRREENVLTRKRAHTPTKHTPPHTQNAQTHKMS